MKKAILQVADTGPVNSLVTMLEAVGYQCYTLSDSMQYHLMREGHTFVLSNKFLQRSMHYAPHVNLPEIKDSKEIDKDCIFFDIKAHKHYSDILKAWPQLENRVAWYRINGGAPEHVINERGDHGDELNPPCPVITPNQCYLRESVPLETRNKTYVFWPHFPGFDSFTDNYEKREVLESIQTFDAPVCLIHGVNGWGYQDIVKKVRKLGVKIYGTGSPDGIIHQKDVIKRLSTAKSLVHLKSNDAPGYALLEAIAAKCPIICSKRLIWRCDMQELFEPGVTCLTFDRETEDPLSSEDAVKCVEEIKNHLKTLESVEKNEEISHNAYDRYSALSWSPNKTRCLFSFRDWLSRNFK